MTDQSTLPKQEVKDMGYTALLAEYAKAIEARDAARDAFNEANAKLLAVHAAQGAGPDFTDAAHAYVVAMANYNSAKETVRGTKKSVRTYTAE